jgi:hypothetical protein
MRAAPASDDGIPRDWAALISEILNNTADSSTADSLSDLFMQPLCDQLIGT